MKTLITILFVFPCYLYAQEITGIWTGSLTTSDKKIPYEIVISDSSGILTGYSHITFNDNGKEIIAVKTIDVTNNNGIVTLEDEDVIDNNFPDVKGKRIQQIATLELSANRSMLFLTGSFKTKKVVDLKPISGTIELQKKSIADSSRLMAKLTAMNLRSSLSFLQIKKITGKVPGDPIPAVQINYDKNLAYRKTIAVAPVIIAKRAFVAPPKDTGGIAIKKVGAKKPALIAAVPDKIIKAPPVAVIHPVVQPQSAVAVKQEPVAKTAIVNPAPVTKPVAVVASSFPKVQPKPDNIPVGAGSDIAHRKIENIETFYIQSDSIVVTLYDNGVVDGDTVTIFLNGKIIMGKVGLSTNPVKKTVYVTPDLGDSLQFIMYAENLGSIPPNTGLMILQDGKKRHEIFFSGDLQKNAAITLVRKPDLN